MASPAIVIPISAHKVIRRKHGRMNILTPQEMLDLLKAARQHSTRDLAMILLAYRHGLRASEVCGIKLADLATEVVEEAIARTRADYEQWLDATLRAFTAAVESRGFDVGSLIRQGDIHARWVRDAPGPVGGDLLLFGGGDLLQDQEFDPRLLELESRLDKGVVRDTVPRA